MKSQDTLGRFGRSEAELLMGQLPEGGSVRNTVTVIRHLMSCVVVPAVSIGH